MRDLGRVAVVGAGLAGLACARVLADAGHDVAVFEKGRGLGGRLAARRSDDWRWDHGAVALKPGSGRFAEYLAQAEAAGHAAAWPPGGLVGLPGMNGVVRPLAEGLEIALSAEVSGLLRGADGWTVAVAGVPDPRRFDRIVLAIPQPQALRLLAQWPSLADRIAGASMRPCWALMAGFDTALPTATGYATFPDGPLATIARDSAKPGRPRPGDAWVIHAGAQWSRAHLEAAPADVVPPLLAAFFAALGCDPVAPALSFAHRWRFGLTETPLGQACVLDAETGLGICGDWCLGDSAEAAHESGRAMAEAIIGQGRVDPAAARG